MRTVVFIIVLLIALLPLSGQVAKYSNEFLAIGVGARALSMANSVIATVDDVTSGYWNPAGLNTNLMNAQAGLMHAEYFAGVAKYDYVAVSMRIDDHSTAGLSVLRFGIDDIPNTLELIDSDGNIRYDRISSFSAADYGFLFSYARTSGIEGLYFGGSMKLLYRRTGEFAHAWGFGFDAAARYDPGKWHFAVAARDITSTFNAWRFNTAKLKETFAVTGNELPENSLELSMPRLILGAARGITFSEKFAILAEMDAEITFDGKRHVLIGTSLLSIDPHFGVEIDYKKIVYLRMGMGNVQLIPDFDEKKSFNFEPTLGLGIRLKKFIIDYALTDIGDQSVALYSNVFSMTYSFNLPFISNILRSQ